MRLPLDFRRLACLTGLLASMAAIFIADTMTDYAVAASALYLVVILAAARLLDIRAIAP